jgi:hypothetical protein
MCASLLLWLVPVVMLHAGVGGECEAKRIPALIRQLGHEKFAVREAASKELDTTEGGELHHFEGHQGAVLGVAFSPDGRQALSCDSQYTVRQWRLPEPEARAEAPP